MIKFEEPKPDFEDIKKSNFIAPEFDPMDFVLGANTKLSEVVVNPGGQWLDFLPDKEYQKKNGVETMSCPDFGSCNQIETLENFLYNDVGYKVLNNYSDRFVSINSGTTTGGNNPNNSCEAIRKFGMIPEALLPFDETIDTWNKFHSPKPPTTTLTDEGTKWLEQNEYHHEWVWTNGGFTSLGQKLAYLMKALEFSPIGISVVAWKSRNGMYWKNNGESDNHWCVLIGYEKDKCWYVFDTYDNFVKKLEWTYDFGFAKRIELKKKLNEADPVLPVEENNMRFFKNIDGTPPIYQIGKDGKYHRFYDENTFKRMYGEFSENVIDLKVISPADIGDPIFVGSSILNVLINFFANLKGKGKMGSEGVPPFYKSKTLWLNVITIAIGILEVVSKTYPISPEVLGLITGFGNLLLRIIDGKPIAFGNVILGSKAQ
jgi:hypothetical protein